MWLVARYTIGALEGEHKRAQTKALRKLKKVLDKAKRVWYPY